ncbi:MAG: DNA cytosine methyltransferase [Caulobacteraceae bacterium]|nr:DNA cytosine methyltransferase [Caulobacteraceae bacterium]
MRLLDIFCGAGGASTGYHQAGFDVEGIDIKHGKRYPFTYHKLDFNTLDVDMLRGYDFIHASPPCQTFSITKNLRNAQGKSTDKVDLLEPTRKLLKESGVPYVIENVPGAPLINPIQLCGSSFGLRVRRHRLFESNLPIVGSICDHKKQGRPVGIYGSMKDEIPKGGKTAESIEQARVAMGIDWMIWGELVEAIPPAYTEYLGRQIWRFLS